MKSHPASTENEERNPDDKLVDFQFKKHDNANHETFNISFLAESREQGTGGFMKKVLSVYTHSMTTIYLSLSAQVAISTFFMKSPLGKFQQCILF